MGGLGDAIANSNGLMCWVGAFIYLVEIVELLRCPKIKLILLSMAEEDF